VLPVLRDAQKVSGIGGFRQGRSLALAFIDGDGFDDGIAEIAGDDSAKVLLGGVKFEALGIPRFTHVRTRGHTAYTAEAPVRAIPLP